MQHVYAAPDALDYFVCLSPCMEKEGPGVPISGRLQGVRAHFLSLFAPFGSEQREKMTLDYFACAIASLEHVRYHTFVSYGLR